MKISELPEDVREKALEYQKNEKYYKTFDKTSDFLSRAFNWRNTYEGYDYWIDWDRQINYTKTITNPYVENNYDSNGVTKPKQYQIGIDTFARAEANLTKEEILAICKFNIDKYNWRQKQKDKEDFQKIIKYAEWALKNL